MYAGTVTGGTRRLRARTFMTTITLKGGKGLAVVGVVLGLIHLVSTSASSVALC